MKGITEPKTEKYLYALLPARDRVMREMERYAAKNHVPVIGPACGRLLYQLARLIQARRVFEMGSAIGYSTLWLARAVGPRGRVFYTDGDPENARRAEEYLRRAGALDRVNRGAVRLDLQRREQDPVPGGLPPGRAAGPRGRAVHHRQRPVVRARGATGLEGRRDARHPEIQPPDLPLA